MRRKNLLPGVCALLILASGCTRAVIPQLINVYVGSPPSVVSPNSNGDYEALPNPVLIEVVFPYGTTLQVAVDGVVLQLVSNPAVQASLQSQNIGFYYVASTTVNSNTGFADSQLYIAAPPSKQNGPRIEIEIEDASMDYTNVGADLVSPPIRIPIVLILPPPQYSPQAAAFAAVLPPVTLQGGFTCSFWADPGAGAPETPAYYGNTAADAAAYYSAVDPANTKTTLAGWRSANGFSPTDDSLDTAKAVYYNAADLGFGRNMHMKTQPDPSGLFEDVAYYVTNYPTVEDARLGTNPIATVAMDYSTVSGINGGSPFIKFFVYSNTGARLPSANLDGCGQKFVPGLCQVCHNGGGHSYVAPGAQGLHNPDVTARFLPFDLDNFAYSTAAGLSRADQETMFELLNVNILYANPSAAETTLIQGWYPCLGSLNCTQQSSFVPPGWASNPSSYLNGVKLSCRTCHVAQDAPYDWSTASSFTVAQVPAQIVQRVCQSNPTIFAGPSITQSGFASQPMPNSRVTWLNFWLSATLPGSQGGIPAQILAATNQTNYGPCPNY